MADLKSIPKPPVKKGEPPSLASTTVRNLDKPETGGNVPLQLKVSPEVRRDFHTYAVGHDMAANELFMQVWAFFKENHG